MRGPYAWTEQHLTSAELEEVTGLSRESQRDLRRRGILRAAGDRHESYSPAQVAEIWLLQGFRTEIKAPLEFASAHVRQATATLLWALLVDSEPWRFEGSPAEARRFRDHMAKRDNDLDGDSKELIGKPRTWLETRYVYWRGGKCYETNNLQEHMEQTRGTGQFGIVLDLFDMAGSLAERLQGPLYIVHSRTKKRSG